MVEDEEKTQMRLDIERLRQLVKVREEIINELEEELTKMGKNMETNNFLEEKRELNAKILDLQIECDKQTTLVLKRDAEIEELKKENDRLEKSNRELANRSICTVDSDESSNYFVEAELLKTSEELEKLKLERDSTLEEYSELKKEMIELRAQLEDTTEHIRNIEKHSKEQEEEIQRLESDIFDLKHGGTSIASCGNSIFAEAMEAERKLEEDLKLLYKEKMGFQAMVKRLTIEKEDAEQKARNAMNRKHNVRAAMTDIDFNDLIRLRSKVQELEKEKTVLWEKLFIKLRSIPKKDLGALICGYFESFKCSIESLKYSQDELARKNEDIVMNNRKLKLEIANVRAQNDEYCYEIESLNRKLKNQMSLDHSMKSSNFNSAPNCSIPSFLRKTNPTDKNTSVLSNTTKLNVSINNLSITPQKPDNFSNNAESEPKNDENNDDWAKKFMTNRKIKKETPKQKYNYVELKMAVKKPLFKEPTLKCNTSQNELKEN